MRGELTAKGRATRQRIIEGAAAVLRERGAALATLDDIMARTGTSKGQLFHYFPAGKDELLVAVAQFEADQVLEDQQPYLGCLDSWEAWQQWRDVVIERYEAQGDECPLGSLFFQIGRSTPGTRAIVIELLRQWQESLAAGVRALQGGRARPRGRRCRHQGRGAAGSDPRGRVHPAVDGPVHPSAGRPRPGDRGPARYEPRRGLTPAVPGPRTGRLSRPAASRA